MEGRGHGGGAGHMAKKQRMRTNVMGCGKGGGDGKYETRYRCQAEVVKLLDFISTNSKMLGLSIKSSYFLHFHVIIYLYTQALGPAFLINLFST